MLVQHLNIEWGKREDSNLVMCKKNPSPKYCMGSREQEFLQGQETSVSDHDWSRIQEGKNEPKN